MIENGTYILDEKPYKFLTDQMGQLTILQEAQSGLSPSPYGLEVTSFDPSVQAFNTNVQPTQRIIRGLARITTADQLKNAHSMAGNPVFAGSNISDDTFDLASNICAQSGTMVHTTDSKTADEILGSNAQYPDISLAMKRQANGSYQRVDNDPAGEVINEVRDFIGDVLEHIRTFKQEVTTFFQKVDNGVMMFIHNPLGTF